METNLSDELVGLVCSTINTNSLLRAELAAMFSKVPADAGLDEMLLEGWVASLPRRVAALDATSSQIDDLATIIGACVVLDSGGFAAAAAWLRGHVTEPQPAA